MSSTLERLAAADPLLDRLLFAPKPKPLTPIPWPAGLQPVTQKLTGTAIPSADVIVTTYTVAEAQALADVLSPGVPSSSWVPYTDGWHDYAPELTSRSPARYSKRLGSYALTGIGSRRVLVFKSELHLATDSTQLPLAKLFGQLVAAVKPSLVITTGTAGGVGAETELGDVLVTSSAKFNCQKAFKAAAFAQQRFSTGHSVPADARTSGLMLPNWGQLKPLATRAPIVATGDVQTVDFFAFDDAEDTYHVRDDDPDTAMEEMDDAVLPLALQSISAPPAWCSIRNASDPQVPKMSDLEAERKWAAGIYARYGYWTTVCSAIACWGVIAAM